MSRPAPKPVHRYVFRAGDSINLFCTTCRDAHWIVLADPALRERTLAELRRRGELEEGVR